MKPVGVEIKNSPVKTINVFVQITEIGTPINKYVAPSKHPNMMKHKRSALKQNATKIQIVQRISIVILREFAILVGQTGLTPFVGKTKNIAIVQQGCLFSAVPRRRADNPLVKMATIFVMKGANKPPIVMPTNFV